MADPSLASNNPFRRKSTVPIASPTSSTAASGLALDTASANAPPHPSLAKSSTFPQSPSDPNTHSGAPGAPGRTANSGLVDDSYAVDYEDQDALRGRSNVTSDAFREHLQALPKSTEAPPSTTFLKPKPVKKVRVQSPPPSSPSSVDSVDAEFEARFPSDLSGAASDSTGAPPTTRFGDYGTRGSLLDDRPVRNYEDYSSESDESESEDSDSVGGRGGSTGTATGSFSVASSLPSFPSQAQQTPPPPNPFQQTLGDLESGRKSAGESQPDPAAAASSGKATFDVDTFSRLLLTGQGPAAAAPPPPPPPPPPARVDTVPSAQETPRTSHEISENDDDRAGLFHGALAANEPAPRQTPRKKPPPPSSRHGKLIKAQPKEIKAPAKESSSGGEDPSFSPSDVNKPLPPPPARRPANVSQDDDDAMDSVFDRDVTVNQPEVNLDPEAPEEVVPSPRPPTPPNVSHSAEFSPSHPTSDLGAGALVASSAAPAAAVAAVTTTTPSPPHSKKPIPAPPPRRQAAGHHRTESRSQPSGDRPPLPAPPPHASLSGDGVTTDQLHDKSPLESPRSSLDSTYSHSRSSSLVKPNANANASSGGSVPAPPPPRRANHAQRPSTGAPPNASGSTPVLSPPGLSDHDRQPSSQAGITAGASTPSLVPQPGNTTGSGSSTPVPNRLLAKPPPPPARNTSVRHKESRPAALASTDSSGSVGSGAGSGSGRPSSIASVDAIARRVGPLQPPPPPPTRQRGSSRGSMDAPASHANVSTAANTPNASALSNASPSIASTPRQATSESVRRSQEQGLAPAEESEEGRADDNGVANNILADLDALRREVDALRGQFKTE